MRFVFVISDQAVLFFCSVFAFFASAASIHADSSTPTEDRPIDEVTFGGQALQGQILRLLPKGIEFEPIHAKGTLTVQHKKIVSQDAFIIFYGAGDNRVQGRLLGVE
jgi:hypothetical protein